MGTKLYIYMCMYMYEKGKARYTCPPRSVSVKELTALGGIQTHDTFRCSTN